MNKKLSKKDLKDWKDFIEGNQSVPDKDNFKNVRKKIYKNLKIKKTENIILNKRVNELSIDELLWIYNFI